MTKRNFGRFSPLALVLGASFAGACGSTPTGMGGSGGGDAVAIAVDPPTADVLTCGTQPLTATVTGTTNTAVSWKVEGAGTVDDHGLYTAPISVPDPAAVTVTATSAADATKSASGTLTLWTALPQAPASAGGAYDDALIHHQLAAQGKRVYAVLATVDDSAQPSAYGLAVARSDDGGATWGKPVKAGDTGAPTVTIDAPSLAIDAGDPDTIYVSYLIHAGSVTETAQAVDDGSGLTTALAVSTDGGMTFKSYVLESRISGYGEVPDVVSPAPGVVAVESPQANDPAYIRMYVDANKGAGFAAKHADGSAQIVDESFDVSASLAGAPFTYLDYDGGSFGFESPRLASDGKGKVCLTYDGGYFMGDGDSLARVAVQCSTDQGKTFGGVLDIDHGGDTWGLHHPTLAFAPSGELTLVYWASSIGGNELRIAHSPDGGTTFEKPTTIPAYQLPKEAGLIAFVGWPALAWDGGTLWIAYGVGDGVGPMRLVVDKSCDGGKTWSGAQLVNGPEPEIHTDYGWPGLFLGDGKPRVYARRLGGTRNAPYDVIQLVP